MDDVGAGGSTNERQARPCCSHNRICVDPNCPFCFPTLGSQQYGGNNVTTTTSWQQATTSLSPPPKTPTLLKNMKNKKPLLSVDLVELPVILCKRDGSEIQALKVIRCGSEDSLGQLRTMLAQEHNNKEASFPKQYSFLKEVGEKHIVVLDRSQESGEKAYKAKHFSKLCICRLHDLPKKPPKRALRPPKVCSDEVIEFSVRQIVSGELLEEQKSTVLGSIRLHRDLPMVKIREEIQKELPQAPTQDGQFVRIIQGDIFPVTPAQEQDKVCTYPLRAKDFAPPKTRKPEIIFMVHKLYYTQGEIVQDETKNRELKSLALALKNQGHTPSDVVKEKAVKYINAFLNSSGGVLLFGVDDDGVVERVPITGKQKQQASDNCPKTTAAQVKEARYAKDHIRKLIDGFAKSMDPAVDNDLVTTRFVPVRPRPILKSDDGDNDDNDDEAMIRQGEDEIYNVIEVHVKRRRQFIHFIDTNSYTAYERHDGSTFVMDKSTILQHSAKGWRHLESVFDFQNLMRRLSDPWAGREWLFAAVRRSLFETTSATEQKIICHGVGICGSRGMGKTSFLSELTLRPHRVTNLKVVAHHLCRSDDPDTLNPALFVHSIAAMLTEHCKEFRKLMVQKNRGGDSVGASMLRALDPEHCESDPDDAFARGILEPLQFIEMKHEKATSLPVLIVIDALDECLSVTAERRPGRSGSTTVLHLLERGLSGGRTLPPWIKLIVSFRMDIVELPGPMQRLAHRLKLIHLDIDSNLYSQASNDIRMYIQAYLERTEMTSPLGRVKGSGSWDFVKADTFAKHLQIQKCGHMEVWEFEDKPGKWLPFADAQQMDLLYSTGIGAKDCVISKGKHTLLVDLWKGKQKNRKSNIVQNIRKVQVKLSGEQLVAPLKDSDEAMSLDNINAKYVRPRIEIGTNEVIARENELLDALAMNSRGNYLYARSVLEEIKNGRLKWSEVPAVPCGLDHLYNSFFRRYKGYDIDNKKLSVRAVQPVLEILLAAPKRGVTERDIIHAVVSGGACDPSSVVFCLRDIQWALDVDSSGKRPHYRLHHESIRSYLRRGDKAQLFECQVENGHKLLAASLIQRCWPQQRELSRWLHTRQDIGSDSLNSSFQRAPLTSETTCEWYRWADWQPNKEDEDIYNLVTHLTQCNAGSDEERISLLRTIDPELLDSVYRSKGTPLHTAAYAGNVAAVKLLLAANASPDIAVNGRCPLHLAAGKGFSDTVSLLLEAGANVASETFNGRTPLLCASGRGSETTVTRILKSIFDVAKKGSNEKTGGKLRGLLDASQKDTGRTSLSLAVEEGHNGVINLLLEAGASVSVADRFGRTPLYYAARYGRVGSKEVTAMVAALGGIEALRWGESTHLRSPLHAAVRQTNVEMVRILLDCGADPAIVDHNARSALHEAVNFFSFGDRQNQKLKNLAVSRNGGEHDETVENAIVDEGKRLEILRLLLKSGRCHLDQGEIHGCTPLWYAARSGWTMGVGLLLDSGACIDPPELCHLPDKNRGGPASPLLFAIQRCDFEMARYLLDRKAQLPAEVDINALASTVIMPKDFLEALQYSILAGKDSHFSAIQSEATDCTSVSQGALDYTMAVKCTSIPKEAFSRSPKEEN